MGNYLGVWLGAGNKHYIHHLVAKVFLDEIDGYCIDHINLDKHDNRLCNLRWVSYSDNAKNKLTHKVKGFWTSHNGTPYFMPPRVVTGYASCS